MLDAVADDCDRVTPIIAVDAPDGLLLDITGCSHLFGGEAELRKGLSQRLRRAGLHARTVIAGGPDTARALARHGHTAIVPVGQEEAVVRSLPIAALSLADEHRTTIQRAGLKTIGALVDRPSRLFASRFGETMTLQLNRLQGLAPSPIMLRHIAPVLWVERRFPEPIGHADSINATLASLVQEVCAHLGEQSCGTFTSTMAMLFFLA